MPQQEEITTMGELQLTDEVLGTDGKWHTVDLLPITEKLLYKFHTTNGDVLSSYDHLWTLFTLNGVEETLSTVEIYNCIERYRYSCVGIKNGPLLLNITPDKHGKCRCINVDSEDSQFLIETDTGEPLFTHNCRMRIVCGNLDSTAFRMALDAPKTPLTEVDGDHKGAGVVGTDGKIKKIQYYYEDHKWLEKWFAERGFDENGFPIGENEKEEEIDLGSDEEEFNISDGDKHYEFENTAKDVSTRHEQTFRGV